MKTDRSIAPIIKNIQSLSVPDYNEYLLPNKTRLIEIKSGTQDILKMEIVHLAGRTVENHRLAARATAMLLREGSKSMTSAQVADKIDYYGASIKSASNMDFSYSTVYTLTKHFSEILPVISEMYSEPLFDADEIDKFKKSNIQKLLEELSKNDVLTYRKITGEIFGENHPYGYNSEVEDYLNLDRSVLLEHFDEYYGSDNCLIFISGKTTTSVIEQIVKFFGSNTKESKKKEYKVAITQNDQKQFRIYSPNEHQSAIKSGCRLFNRNHPDHAAFFMLNTIFGGYFGSRLMTNIREKAGYTYDIFSSMDQMIHDGCFYVSTELNSDFIDQTLEAIYYEMDVLCEKKVPAKELSMVKNYVMGNFLNFLDGPLNVSGFIRSLILTGMKISDFEAFITEIKEMKSERIRNVAQNYFQRDKMIEVILQPEL
ncbi:MAG: insulinase family protein [Saprospiraceae bacterium]|nr:insulinase family protein [Saprospiraceae bacterium]